MKNVVEYRHLPETITRDAAINSILKELGDTEDTQILIDQVKDMWDTMDELSRIFEEDSLFIHARGRKIL